jgi:hypothetical protein
MGTIILRLVAQYLQKRGRRGRDRTFHVLLLFWEHTLLKGYG